MSQNTGISLEDKLTFIKHGVLVRRSFVSLDLIQLALQLIEEWYESCFMIQEVEKYTQTSFAPNLKNHPDLLSIYHKSCLHKLVSSLIYPDSHQPVLTAQTQIRIPNQLFSIPQPEKSMHIDGVACPHLGLGELRTFTLLIGVLLSEVNSNDAGALRYIPGGHIDMAKWFCSERQLEITKQVPSYLETKPEVSFVGKPGDVVVMHHLVPHAVGLNNTSSPRIMLYFRIKHERHDEHILDALRNPWLEFPNLQKLSN
jgi:hypothetical protein